MRDETANDAWYGTGGSTDPLLRWDDVLLSAACVLFYLGVFFPYGRIIPLESDTQPYAVMAAFALVLAAREWRVPIVLSPLVLVFAFSLGVILLGQPGTLAIRSVTNYASLVLITYATLLVLDARPHLFRYLFRAAVLAWFVVGFIQTVFYPDFLVFLTPRALGKAGFGGRGVVGLSPEPTHYGLFCLLLLILLNIAKERVGFSQREVRWHTGLLIVQTIVFARSSMAILLLGTFIGWYILVNMYSPRRALYLLVGVLIGGGILGAVIRSGVIPIQGTRMYNLLGQIVANPKLVLLVDGSVNDRVFHIVFAVLGMFENLFLPNGYTAWADYVAGAVPRFSPYAWHVTTTRIMTGYGSAMFELGFVGLLIPLVINVALFRYMSDVRSFLIVGFALNTMLWMSIPLATPLVGLTIGFLLYHIQPVRAGDREGGQLVHGTAVQ